MAAVKMAASVLQTPASATSLEYVKSKNSYIGSSSSHVTHTRHGVFGTQNSEVARRLLLKPMLGFRNLGCRSTFVAGQQFLGFHRDEGVKKTGFCLEIAAKAVNVGMADSYRHDSSYHDRTLDVVEEVSEEVVVTNVKAGKRFNTEIIFAIWWGLNAVFNIYNKMVLNVFPFPWLTSTLSLAAGSTIMLASWALRIVEPPKVDAEFLRGLAPVALLHTIGFVAATLSLSKVAVSSHHIIKSAEPACSVIVSKLFFGDSFSLPVYLSLIPIIGGCGLAAATELNFNMTGFVGAMVSNFAFVIRNIFSKKGMRKGTNQVGGMNYYACLSMMSLVFLTPFAFAMEGPKLWAAGWSAANQSVGKQFVWWVMAQSVLYHLHNQVSYMSLDQISPLSFSIGNTMKRVIVIVSSIIVFHTQVRPINAVGAAIAILGTFLYSQAK